MIVLGIDLAERHSAAVLLTGDGPEVELALDAGPSSGPTLSRMHLITDWWAELYGSLVGREYFVVMEDIHPFAVNPKPALRLQGALMAAMAANDVEAMFVPASRWQKHFGYRKEKGRSSKGWAAEICQQFGYTPPEWARGKQVEDLRDAYLIARYAMEVEVWH